MIAPHPVHPRVCGEHVFSDSRPLLDDGSSPRVRGTPASLGRISSPSRFIPACAGNTGSMTMHRHLSTVHPRVCGEHASSACDAFSMSGSSPRVRGTPAEPVQCPAVPPVHPRVCGEHARPRSERASEDGSSPRVRGTPGMRRAKTVGWRFIPACAGNTVIVTVWVGRPPVHPRVCGEHPWMRSRPRCGCTVHPRVCGEHGARG